MTPEQIVTEYFGSYEGDEELSPTQVRQRLVERIRAYGGERAAQERERCVQVAAHVVRRMPPKMAERLTVEQVIAAIRALP